MPFCTSGLPVGLSLLGCTDPTDAVFCFATDPYKTTYTMTKALIAAMGGKGNIVHLTGLLIDTNTTLREQAVQKALAARKLSGSESLPAHVTLEIPQLGLKVPFHGEIKLE